MFLLATCQNTEFTKKQPFYLAFERFYKITAYDYT